MENLLSGAGFRRRDVFRLAATTGLLTCAESFAFAADFWNKTKPADWSDQEKQELRTKSPWAKKVDAEMSGGRGGGGGEDAGGGGGGGGRGGGGGGRGGGGGLIPQLSGGPQISLEIVWQSAKPILDAHPVTIPPRLDNHYVLAVTGIPPMVIAAAVSGRGARGGSGGGRFGGQAAAGGPPPDAAPGAPPDPTAGLRRATTLAVKGKDPVGSDVVMSMGANNSTLLFGFPKDALPLAVADKEVEFMIKLGSLSAKTKFNLKDMTYNGALAL